MSESTSIVVGVGASAGGLDAFSRLLQSIPRDFEAAWVFVQHLDPTHESLMAELLAKHTDMPVREVTSDEPICAGRVYVIPPNSYLTVDAGRLRLGRPEAARGERMAVDHFFRSLAGAYGANAVGVVLSGTGTDGTGGLRVIKAAGGCTIAQDPETAAYDGMPHSAVRGAGVDLVLPIEEIPGAIARFAGHPYAAEASRRTPAGDAGSARDRDESAERDEHDPQFGEVLGLIRERAGIDLSQYKPATIRRRVLRRMGLRDIRDLGDYLEHLRRDASELQELARDMLISVTDFFRDPEAFAALREKVAPLLFEMAAAQPPEERAVRVWVPGCATGEEAYSIAIVLEEERRARWASEGVGVQIFATDVDADAIRFARAATYPESALAHIEGSRRGTHFQPLDTPGQHRVRQHVRETVSFAEHNVLADPPFSRMHLVSCRNLLIYLRRGAQDAAISTFQFALRPGGVLMLGPSESLGEHASSFRVLDKQWRLYERLETGSKHGVRVASRVFRRQGTEPDIGSPRAAGHNQQRSGELAALRLVARTAARPGVLINAEHQVLHLHGDLIEFLDLPTGASGMNLFDMVRDEARTRVRAAVFRVARKGDPVTTRGTITLRAGETRRYVVTATPCASRELGDDLVMVGFELEAGEAERGRPEPAMDSVNDELNREVEELRRDLRSTVEELERANEDLRSSNEESMTMNEELQSTNEELETQSEELRSVNEELITVNGQLREKLDELQNAHADIANLLNSTKLPAVFLDRNFCIRRYTPEARALLSVIESDVGRPIRDLSGVCVGDGMLDDAQRVIEGLAPVEKEIRDDRGDWYLRRILPYRTSDDRIDGVVVTFSRVTRLKELTAAVTAEREQQRAVSDIGLRALREYDLDAISQHACSAVARTLGCEYCKVLELLPDRSGLRLVAGVGWKDGLVGRAVVPNELESQAGFTLAQSGPVVVPDLEKETRFSAPEILRSHGVRSGLSVILHGPGGRVYGVLGVHSTRPRAFDAHQVSFVQQVANVLSGTMQRLEAERVSEESRERFRTLADNISQFVWMTDEEGSVVWYNKRWLEYTGLSAAEMDAEGWLSIVHPEHGEAVSEKIERHFRSGDSWEDTVPLRSEGGDYRWFLARALPIGDGDTTAWFGTFTDVTEIREAKAALEESRRKLQSIIDNAPAAIYAKDLDGRFVLSNTSHARVLGTTPGGVLGKSDDDFAPSRQLAAVYRENDLKVATTGVPIEVEETVTFDGRDRHFLSQKFPLRTAAGEVYAVCGISADITQRKLDEQHLRTVMAELNHRVKNTLASVQALARVTAGNAGSLAEFQASFSDRLMSMGVAHALLTRSEWRGATIADIVGSEVSPRVGSTDQLRIEGPDVMLRPKRALALHMAVHELATNAAKYGALSDARGSLEVFWEIDESGDEPMVRLRWTERGGSKPSGETVEGFGSRMIRDTVTYELGGGVEFELTETGLSASLRFPLSPATADRLYPARRPPAMPGKKRQGEDRRDGSKGRVLVVEDNATLARYLIDHLAESGYEVSGPFEAVDPALAQIREAVPAVALLDVDLDGVHVYPVADALRERGVPFAFVSGFNTEDLPEPYRGARLFTKPFDLDAITDWLAAAAGKQA